MIMNTIQQSSSPSSLRFNGQILQSVYRVWLFRRLAPVLIGETILLSLLLYGMGRLIFVQRVLENGLNVFFANPPQIVSFLFEAFLHARGITKLLAVIILVLVALLIRHVTQGILRLILVRQNYFARVKQ